MNDKTGTRAKKLDDKRGLYWTFLAISAFFLYSLPKELLKETLAFLRVRGIENGLRILWARNPSQLMGLAIFAGLALVFLICLLRILILSVRIKTEKENIPANIPAEPGVTEKGGAPMNRNSKQPLSKGAMTVMWVIIAAVMVFAVAADEEAVIPAVGTMAIITVILLLCGAANKKAAEKGAAKRPSVELHRPFPAPKPGKPAAALLRHKDEEQAEEAITCAHVRGKEKYIQQLDSYLKAGLIDKSEYRIMKERYEKLEIPEDYH